MVIDENTRIPVHEEDKNNNKFMIIDNKFRIYWYHVPYRNMLEYFYDEEEAIKEAKLLAEKYPKSTFYVFQQICQVSTKTPVVVVENSPKRKRSW